MGSLLEDDGKLAVLQSSGRGAAPGAGGHGRRLRAHPGAPGLPQGHDRGPARRHSPRGPGGHRGDGGGPGRPPPRGFPVHRAPPGGGDLLALLEPLHRGLRRAGAGPPHLHDVRRAGRDQRRRPRADPGGGGAPGAPAGRAERPLPQPERLLDVRGGLDGHGRGPPARREARAFVVLVDMAYWSTRAT
ncbi:MAG: hypothetical protein MZV63_14145 [Marinilabiliales bacterium]|nr:hypothetical protein [Marinilabiliales bacterium]